MLFLFPHITKAIVVINRCPKVTDFKLFHVKVCRFILRKSSSRKDINNTMADGNVVNKGYFDLTLLCLKSKDVMNITKLTYPGFSLTCIAINILETIAIMIAERNIVLVTNSLSRFMNQWHSKYTRSLIIFNATYIKTTLTVHTNIPKKAII